MDHYSALNFDPWVVVCKALDFHAKTFGFISAQKKQRGSHVAVQLFSVSFQLKLFEKLFAKTRCFFRCISQVFCPNNHLSYPFLFQTDDAKGLRFCGYHSRYSCSQLLLHKKNVSNARHCKYILWPSKIFILIPESCFDFSCFFFMKEFVKIGTRLEFDVFLHAI